MTHELSGDTNAQGRRLQTSVWLRWVAFAALLLPGLVFVVVDQIQRMGDFRVDDAYITFSFSKNLAEGKGPIYGYDLKVEGYSNFLWMLLVAVGYVFHLDPYLTARALSFLCLAGALIAGSAFIVRRGSHTAAFCAALFLVCNSDLIRASLSGLETTAFAASLLIAWVVYLWREMPKGISSLWAFLPVALLRIDGFVAVLVVIGFEFVSSLIERRFSLKSFGKWLAGPTLVFVAYFAWRALYYGLPLPTTYYAKNMVQANEAYRGWHQLKQFVEESDLLWLTPLCLLPVLLRRRREALGLLVPALVHFGYAAHVGGDWMPFWRFFLPSLPLLATLAGLGLADLKWLFALKKPGVLRFALPSAAVLLAVLGIGGLVHVAQRFHMATVETPLEGGKLGHAEHIKRHTRENLLGSVDLLRHVIRKPGEKLVTDYAGVFAVYTDASIIDMWGLCNADIALKGGINGINPIYGKECAACYADFDPDYFHIWVPLVRTTNAFRSKNAALRQIFQAGAIGRYLDFKRDFSVGYVTESATDRTFWFLEKKRPGFPLVERQPAPGIVVRYPFEGSIRRKHNE